MRNLKRPLEWACDQDWPWEGETWRVSYDEKRWVMDKLENLCSQLATVATKRKAHEASIVARESMSLEEYHEAIEADYFEENQIGVHSWTPTGWGAKYR